MNQSVTKVFVEQPLASPGSDKYCSECGIASWVFSSGWWCVKYEAQEAGRGVDELMIYSDHILQPTPRINSITLISGQNKKLSVTCQPKYS